MSKTSTVQRAAKRVALAAKFSTKIPAWEALASDPASADQARAAARLALAKVPRDARPVRQVSRCSATGRAGSVLRKFGLCRHEVRRRAMSGDLPGVAKASW